MTPTTHEPPPLVQRQGITREAVLLMYARYRYGTEQDRSLTSGQLHGYADAADEHGLTTMAIELEQWADEEHANEQRIEHEADAEYQRHVDHLRRDYR